MILTDKTLYILRKIGILLIMFSFSLNISGKENEKHSFYSELEEEFDRMFSKGLSPSLVIDYARKSYRQSVLNGDVNAQVHSMLALAHSYYREGVYMDSVKFYMCKIYRLHDQLTSEELVHRIRYFSAILESYIGNFETALTYVHQSLFFRMNRGLNYEHLYNMLAYLHSEMGNIDSSIYYYDLSESLFFSGDPHNMHWVMLYLNAIEKQIIEEDYEKANENLARVHSLCVADSNETGRLKCALVYARYHYALNQMDSVVQWLRKVKVLDVNNVDYLFKLDVAEAFFYYYQRLEKSDSALLYLKNYVELYDSYYNTSHVQEIKNNQYYYSQLLNEARLENASQAIFIIKQRIHSSIAISVLSTLTLIITIYIYFQHNRKRMRMIRKEKEEAYMKLLMANRNIVYNEKSITSFALDIVRRNEFMYQLRNEVNALLKLSEAEIKDKLQEIMVNVNTVLNVNDNAKEILEETNQLSQGFYTKLEHALPTITNKDKRLCALILMGLSQKEIAVVLNMSINTVNSSIYRMKKRFDLSRKDSFKTFLSTINNDDRD